jgi:Polyketide cyclase / dehydrase and lipid transport
MATIRTSLDTAASPDEAWAAIRDVGALHTRLAPGFIADTKLEPGVRVVTFANGMVVREPIVTIDDEAQRLVWTAESERTTHYNASLQVSPRPDGGATVVWTADFLPNDIKPQLTAAIEAGTRAMKRSLDALAK